VGALPGAGADIAAWMSYGMSKRFSKEPEKFGTGHVEGIVESGAANNSALGGAWIPALVFGIPGDSITAIAIGVLYLKNMNPGPTLFVDNPQNIYAVFIVFILAQLLMLPFGWMAIKVAKRILRIPAGRADAADPAVLHRRQLRHQQLDVRCHRDGRGRCRGVLHGTLDFGLIGLAVMGQNLVLNVESRGFAVSVYNRTPQVTHDFVAAHPGKRMPAATRWPPFVASLARPRKVMLMVKAGAAVDAVIEQLLPLLEPDDIVIDGGNSLYTDTERRDAWLAAAGPALRRRRVSAAARKARARAQHHARRPASTWAEMRPIFEAIAARVDGEPCVIHIGPGGAGHYVKMVHNGIEYGDMQLICEAYALLQAAGMTAPEMAAVFDQWNQGELQSYLIEITAGAASNATPTPAAAGRPDPGQGRAEGHRPVDADQRRRERGGGQHHQRRGRGARAVVDEGARVAASTQLQGPGTTLDVDRRRWCSQVHEALYASKIISYAQGLDLMRTISAKKGWGWTWAASRRIWRGGCIIRARFLGRITEAYRADPALPNLMLAPYFRDVLNRASRQPWREVVALAVAAGIPVPAFSASLAYYDSLPQRAAAGQPAAGAARLLRRAHLRACRPAAGQFFHTPGPR
jgi:6-phosphogluconate dehydrogenase